MNRGILLISVTLLMSSCATYYQQNSKFQEAFVRGDIATADKILDKNKKAAEKRDRLIYFLQKGVVEQMQGNLEESNAYFEQAYLFTEDYRKNVTTELVSLLTNSSTKPYTGEDYELILLHYFKSLNYLELGRFEEALVESRRIDIKLNALNDHYGQRKNRYAKDAFAMTLTGLTYEADGDINNAFISYRNAYEAYKNDYATDFNTSIPLQLKKDLLRSAYLNGFQEELADLEKELGMTYTHHAQSGGEVVFFWHNGLGPVKDEWSVNFVMDRGNGGLVVFENEELGLNFPFPLPPKKDETQSDGLGDLKVVRAAFPKYLERPPLFSRAEMSVDGRTFPFEKAEDINAIAYSTLQDRMLREMGTSLLRLALKQAAEEQLRKENQELGALLSVLNAVSEKADTRNWQTLPHDISYVRIPVSAGSHRLSLITHGYKDQGMDKVDFDVEVGEGQMVFRSYWSLESLPLGH